MPAEHTILCGTASGAGRPAGGARPLRLRLGGPAANVRLALEDLRRPLWANVPEAFLDLLDVAAYVYAADQALSRGSLQDAGFGARWRRDLAFAVPVRAPDFWDRPEVRDALVGALSFLSEDRYAFSFEPARDRRPAQSYLGPGAGGGDWDGIEEVILFSGGLDSLGGAVTEALLERKKVVLVNHRSTGKLAPRHRQLVDLLGQMAQGACPLHLPVRANKDRALTKDHNQRTRSFLYASLGAAVAAALGRRRLRMYENGVVALNLPPAGQVVGARASRTAHPQTVNALGKLFTLLAGRPFAVENPFLWRTKAEVLELIAQADCGDLIAHTTSCGGTLGSSLQHPHCGVCSQCLDRRFAVLAAGLGRWDPADAYRVGLLTGERAPGPQRTMLAVYLDLVNRVGKMTPAQFFGRFGEASRVLRHVGLDPEAAAQQVFALYRRHAEAVRRVVKEGFAKHGEDLLDRELPAGCLLRLVYDDGGRGPDAPAAADPPLEAANVFRRAGKAWQVRFAGGRPFLLLPSKGAAYLHRLLAVPGEPVSAVDLAVAVAKDPRRFCLGDTGGADREALAAYRARFEELEALLAEARANADPAAQEKYQGEMAALLAEINRQAGLGGRPRTGSDRNRVRLAVGNAVRRAIKDIRLEDARLAQHLASPRLTLGYRPCYQPGGDVRWDT
jgi:hypothetical protein